MLKVALSTIQTNIYDMSRSHEGLVDKQHIFHGSTPLCKISSAKDGSIDTEMTQKFIYLTLTSKAYESCDDT